MQYLLINFSRRTDVAARDFGRGVMGSSHLPTFDHHGGRFLACHRSRAQPSCCWVCLVSMPPSPALAKRGSRLAPSCTDIIFSQVRAFRPRHVLAHRRRPSLAGLGDRRSRSRLMAPQCRRPHCPPRFRSTRLSRRRLRARPCPPPCHTPLLSRRPCNVRHRNGPRQPRPSAHRQQQQQTTPERRPCVLPTF